MAHLRLVAGTAVTETQQEQGRTAAQVAQNQADSDIAKMEAKAREVIYNLKLGLDGLSVSELLVEINLNRTTEGMPTNEFIEVIQRNGDIRDALLTVGIHAHSALPEQELDVALFGLVLYPKRLLKACPELKSLKAILEGLTL